MKSLRTTHGQVVPESAKVSIMDNRYKVKTRSCHTRNIEFLLLYYIDGILAYKNHEIFFSEVLKVHGKKFICKILNSIYDSYNNHATIEMSVYAILQTWILWFIMTVIKQIHLRNIKQIHLHCFHFISLIYDETMNIYNFLCTKL